jgi:hypothetical protein
MGVSGVFDQALVIACCNRECVDTPQKDFAISFAWCETRELKLQ